VGLISVVVIVTRCGLDNPGIGPGAAGFFRTRPDQPWGPPSLLYNEYRFSFSELKRPGSGVDNPLPSRAEIKENFCYTSTLSLGLHGLF
jgi:hypothetical protein